MSYRDGNGEIYVMNNDGSGQTRITNFKNQGQCVRYVETGKDDRIGE